MKHFMRLKIKPFSSIWNGEKTIELRLLDEKRRKIKAGDIIGEMVISAAGEPITTVPVVAEEDGNKLNLWQAIWKVFAAVFEF